VTTLEAVLFALVRSIDRVNDIWGWGAQKPAPGTSRHRYRG